MLFISCDSRIFTYKKKPKLNERQEKIRQGYADGSHSAIEVTTYVAWNAETIKERSNTLLEFIEKRWDKKFENEAAMAELLFLEFMFEKEDLLGEDEL